VNWFKKTKIAPKPAEYQCQLDLDVFTAELVETGGDDKIESYLEWNDTVKVYYKGVFIGEHTWNLYFGREWTKAVGGDVQIAAEIERFATHWKSAREARAIAKVNAANEKRSRDVRAAIGMDLE
jgi:hypothetical protein